MMKHEADALRKLVRLISREAKTPTGQALIASLEAAIAHFEQAEGLD